MRRSRPGLRPGIDLSRHGRATRRRLTAATRQRARRPSSGCALRRPGTHLGNEREAVPSPKDRNLGLGPHRRLKLPNPRRGPRHSPSADTVITRTDITWTIVKHRSAPPRGRADDGMSPSRSPDSATSDSPLRLYLRGPAPHPPPPHPAGAATIRAAPHFGAAVLEPRAGDARLVAWLCHDRHGPVRCIATSARRAGARYR